MIKQTTILTLVLALASHVAIACNPAEGSGQCGFYGADGIKGERSGGGQPFAEAVADFEQGGGDDFEDDGEGEGEPGVHVDSWFGSVLRTG